MPSDVPSVTRFGPFELIRQLGEGGMGVVYEARDGRSGQTVALKVLNREKAGQAMATKRFEREARAAGRLAHPGICEIYDAGELNGISYFTMELLAGRSLEQLVEASGTGLPWRESCRILRDVSLALEHAHQQGIIHRDMKPSNVILDATGRAKVVDFGLARDEEELDRLTRTGALLGTPTYMAPERFDKRVAKDVGVPADVYSLGVTLYETLTGKLPFNAPSLYEVVKLIRKGDPEPLVLPPGAPRTIAPLVLKAMARAPEDRFASCAELADALDEILTGGERAPQRGLGAWMRAHPIAFLIMCAVAPAPPVLLGHSLAGRTHATPGDVAAVPSALAGETPASLVSAARERSLTGDLEGARDLYDRALTLAPGNEDALLEKVAVVALAEDLDRLVALKPLVEGKAAHPVGRVLKSCAFYGLGFSSDPGPVYPDERHHPIFPILVLLRGLVLPPPETLRLVEEELALHPKSGFLAAHEALLLGELHRETEALQLLDVDRTYEGIGEDVRDYARGRNLEWVRRNEEAEKCFESVHRERHLAVRARSELSFLAFERGDAARVVALHEGKEPGPIETRLGLARSFVALGRPGEARAVLDDAVTLAEEYGDYGAILHAAGDSRAVLDLVRTAHARRLVRDVYEKDAARHARGMRARFAARAGDIETARADLDRLADDPIEAKVTRAVISLARGDFVGSARDLVEEINSENAAFPGDLFLDVADALKGAGDEGAARRTLTKLIQLDHIAAGQARDRIAALDAIPEIAPGQVLLDEKASDKLMTGGARSLVSGTRWSPERETVYGFAPVIFIPEKAASRSLEVEVSATDPVTIQILPGAVPTDDHVWWSDGHAPAVTSGSASTSPSLVWKAEAGTWTILVSSALPKGTDPVPVRLQSVKARLR